ncbi:ATP-binding protein [Saccharospirillum impatiens]|uniref:ATP-binding protein n=1 Tax=Saccharospirillum impatiens TaxID=169438 RepID=UPI0004146821|nr:ATP-binding protein [Saccharospirillum impatiens]
MDVLEQLFFRGMWQNTRDTMFLLLVKDDDFFIHNINPVLEAVVGVSSDQLKGTRVADFLPDHEVQIERYRNCQREDKTIYYEEAGVAPDGSVHYFHTMLVPIWHEGHQYLLGSSRNIDDIKEAETVLAHAKEEAESANRAKNLFLANMSHELRTPLNGIVGTVSLLRARGRDPELLEHLDLVERSAAAMERLTADILDLSKIENNRLDIDLAPCNLREPVRDSYVLVQQQAEDKQLDYHCAIDDNLPGQVLADSARIRQILSNLLTNAIKFTDSGKVELAVHYQQTTPETGLVNFVVSDNGIGIPQEKLANVGIPFYQISPERNRGHEGSGIGLSVCKSLAELMDGRFHIESQAGNGTRVSVHIPVRLLIDTLDSDKVPQPGIPSGLSILVAEDNPANQIIIRRMVQFLEADVEVVKTGLDAVRRIQEKTFDLVLMDINMPEMDGITATRQLRAEGYTLPIVALTAAVIDEERQACSDAGMNGFVPKPVRIETLRAAIRDAFS